MWRRLSVISRVYARRPILWVCLAVYCAALLCAYRGLIPAGRNPARTAAFPGELSMGFVTRAIGHEGLRQLQSQPGWAALKRLELRPGDATDPHGPGPAELQKSAPMNLKGLAVVSFRRLSDADVAALAELSSLEELALIGCELPEGLWSALSRLPRLKHLDVSGASLAAAPAGLKELASLETLVLTSPAGGCVTGPALALLTHVRELPRLRHLVFGCTTAANAREASAWKSAWRNFTPPPSLKVLFVDDGMLAQLRTDADLPSEIAIRPAFIPRDHDFQILVAALALMALSAAPLFLQLSAQFSTPQSRLLPGYDSAHLGVALGLWVLTAAANTLVLGQAGVSALAVAGVQGGATLFVGLLLLADFSRERLRGAVLGILILGAAGLTRWSTSEFDWYLRGHFPQWALGLTVSGALTGIAVLWQVRRLSTLFLERGVSAAPLSLDPAEMARWRSQTRAVSGWWQWLQSRSLNRILAARHGAGLWSRCGLWCAANPVSGAQAFSLIIAVFLGIWVLMRAFRDQSLQPGEWLTDSAAVLTLIMIPDFPLISLTQVWRSRQRMWGIESLRPVSRRDFARQIAQAIAWDLIPLAVVYGAVVVILAQAVDPAQTSLLWWTGLVLYFASRWGLAFGLILWVITVRRGWILALVLVPAVYAILFVNVAIVLLQGRVLGWRALPPDLPDWGSAGFLGLAAALAAVALATATTAYRRWQRIELA